MFLDVLVKIGIPSFATKGSASTAPPPPALMLLILCILAQRIKILYVIPPWVEQKSSFPTPQHALHRRQQPQQAVAAAQESCGWSHSHLFVVRLPYVAPGRRSAECEFLDRISSGVSLLIVVVGAVFDMRLRGQEQDK